MSRIVLLGLVGLICMTSSFAMSSETQQAAHYFQSIAKDPGAVRAFITDMPKGGLLHEHFWGTEFAENLIDFAQKDHFCVDPEKQAISNTNSRCPTALRLSNIRTQPKLYSALIDSWSMRNFLPSNSQSGHDHFFAAFEKFYPIQNTYRSDVLASEVKEAASEKVDYIELMVMNHFDDIIKLSTVLTKKQLSNPTAMQASLIKQGLPDLINSIQRELENNNTEMRKKLNCDKNPNNLGCQVVVRYQYAAFRDSAPGQVFTMLLASFMLANQSPDVVAINLVGPEDGYPSMHDYAQHMAWIEYLRQQYPKAHIDLHAGELTQTLVPPQGLRDHISQAVYVAGAERIGHGVDIMHEIDSEQLAEDLRKKGVLVEINLTSNDEILGVTGKQSQLPFYLSHHVPVALSRDDAGILRTDLNNEFTRAAVMYQLDYSTLRLLVNNSITYSFLPGKSLWENPEKEIPINACKNQVLGNLKPSRHCRQFLDQSEKARMQWRLQRELREFEQQYV